MKEDFFGQSEWNEQQLYAQLFFQATAKCRNAQMNRNLEEWRRGLESKISLLMGIVKPEEKRKLNELRKHLNLRVSQYNAVRNVKKTEEIQKFLSALIDTMIYTEADIDTMANLHMPFLKRKTKASIKGL